MDRMTFLTKAKDFKHDTLDVENIGTVHVREVSAADSAEFGRRGRAKDADELTNGAWLATRVLCDEHGTLILGEADIPALKDLPLRVLKSISGKAEELSGLAEDAKKNV